MKRPVSRRNALEPLAARFGRDISYDPDEMRCIADEEADAALWRAHREGWGIG